MKKLNFNKIPEYTEELEQGIHNNTERLISMGVKDWKRKRKGKPTMTEVEQKEMVRKLEDMRVDE